MDLITSTKQLGRLHSLPPVVALVQLFFSNYFVTVTDLLHS